MTYQTIKSLCEDFEMLANRCHESAATNKQCWFLAKLAVEKGIDSLEKIGWEITDRSITLSKSRISRLIDGLLKTGVATW